MADGDLEVVHCDNHLLVVAKPAGVPMVPDSSADASSITELMSLMMRVFVRVSRFTVPRAESSRLTSPSVSLTAA